MMEQFFQRLEETFYSGDPEVRSWFLVRHDFLPLLLCGSYALFSSVVGPALMKNRKPFDLRIPMVLFNFAIVLTYAVTLCVIFWNLPKLTLEEYCTAGKVTKGEATYTVVSCCWVFYVLKYVEFFDTVFFVLRKKQKSITFLHVMHHTVVPLLGWTLLRTEKSGYQSVLVILNSCVHVVMYSYYGLAAMGPSMKKYLWWKKYLTQLQMMQFLFIIVFVAVITPLTGCTMVHTSFLMDSALAPIFLFLFYRFYKITFRHSGKSSATNGATKH